LRAVLLKEHGKPQNAFEIRDVELPTVKENQVLIKVEAFGLNFADVLARNGMYPDMPPKPCILGYEVVGTVTDTGGKESEHLKGKRVVAFTRFGGYAEYVATDYRALAEIDQDMDHGTALALATQYTTAFVCFHKSLVLHKGDKVLVHAGAGGVGIALCQLALHHNCEVYATAGSEEKLRFLKQMGVHHPVNYRANDYEERIKQLLNGTRLDATFNSLSGKSVSKDLRLLGPGGKLILFGAASRVGKGGGLIGGLKLLFQTGFFTPLKLIMSSKGIVGVNLLRFGDHKPELVAESMTEVVRLTREGHLKPVVNYRFGIDQLNEAHTALESRNTIGKVIVSWET
jgi:NADPH2:quinone reductase